MNVLVVNCGSSSIKFQMYEMPEQRVLAKGQAQRIGEPASELDCQVGDRRSHVEQAISDHAAGMDLILQTLRSLLSATGAAGSISISAVGHRVVHGGEAFTGSVLINDDVEDTIQKCADLAPLHNPANLTGIRAARRALPEVPHVACFDTAFHASIPEFAHLYALPYEMYERFGIRRYGFHGTSHRYVAKHTALHLGKPRYETNCITCHLGNGCSMAAVREGKCVDTSMGLTPLEGLVMGTRSGDFDPAILFYLADHGYQVEQLNRMCNKQSGLLGVSGISNDMRTLTAEAEQGQQRAQLAIDIFSYRIKKYIGMYLAVLGHVDAISFTGGIGENSPLVRAKACAGLESLGIEIDPVENDAVIGREGCLSPAGSRIQVLVIPTDEEGVIATDTYTLVEQGVNLD